MQKIVFLIICVHLISVTYGQRVAGIRFTSDSQAGTLNSGYIEILNGDTNEWGSICTLGAFVRQQFGSTEAKVVCAMLGFRNFGASVALYNSGRTLPTGTVWLTQLKCREPSPGNSSSWNINNQCEYVGWGVNLGTGCQDHKEDAAVWCGPDTFPFTTSTAAVSVTPVTPNLQTLPSINCTNTNSFLRLAPGPTQGRIEIRKNATDNWGTVCAGSKSSFGQNEAKAICATLCKWSDFATPLPASSVLPPSGSTGVALDNLRCPVNSTDFNQCSHDGWNNVASVCNPATMSIGVQCGFEVITPAPPPSIQVVCQNYRATAYFIRTSKLDVSLINLEKSYDPSKCDFKRDQNATYVWVDFPIIGCNEVLSSNATHITYTVYLFQNVSLNNANVSVDNTYSIPIACALPKVNRVTGLPINPGLVTLPPIIGNQPFYVSISLFGGRDQNGNFIEALQMPARVAVGKRINVVVDLLGSSSAVRLVVLQCAVSQSATSTNPKLSLITNKCGSEYCDSTVPRNDPTYCTRPGDYRVVATPLTDQRFYFYFSAFQWSPGDTSSQLFIDCQVYACNSQDSTDASCSATCGTTMPSVNKRKRRSANNIFSVSNRRRRSVVQPDEVKQFQLNGPIIVEGKGINFESILKNTVIKRSTMTTASVDVCLLTLFIVVLCNKFFN